MKLASYSPRLSRKPFARKVPYSFESTATSAATELAPRERKSDMAAFSKRLAVGGPRVERTGQRCVQSFDLLYSSLYVV